MENGKISPRQLAFLMTNVVLATVIIFMPQLGARELGQDGWLSAIIATLWGILVVLPLVALGERYPAMTFVEYLPLVLGKPLGKILGAFYVFWFLATGGFILRTFSMFLSITIMPSTPVSVFSITLLVLVYYAVKRGIEAWVRVSEVLLPLIILSILMVMILPYNQMDLGRLLPVGEHSMSSLLAGSLLSGSWRGEFVLIGMFLPLLADNRHTVRNLYSAVIAIGVILVGTEIATVAVFGAVNTGQFEFPFFSLARMISLARVFDRVEVLIVMTWVVGIFIKLCAFLYCSTRSFVQVCGFTSSKHFLFPVALLMFAISDNVASNVSEVTDFMVKVWPGFALLSFEMLIPWLVYLVASLRSGLRRGEGQ